MIRNNLAKLLIDRGIKATTLANETGIARSTLSKISNNTTAKIEYSTLDSICTVLKIYPGDFFEYTPINVSFTFEIGNRIDTKGESMRGAPPSYEVFGFINFHKYGDKIASVEYEGSIDGIYEYVDGNEVNYFFGSIHPSDGQNLSIYDEISIAFRTDISNLFHEFIQSTIDKHFDVANEIGSHEITINLI